MKNRHHVRKKEAKKILSDLENELEIELTIFRTGSIELAETENIKIILINNRCIGFYIGSKPFLTLRGFLALGDSVKNAKKYVTVDKGAVKFVSSGADVMIPGIVDVDENIETGNIVWINDENHKKPLAVGEALIPGTEIAAGGTGKAVKSLHYIGDKLWAVE